MDGTAHRFARSGHGPVFWILLWAAVVAAEFGALVPVLFERDVPVEAVDVVFRLIGGSFAACGLIAWHRRPDNRSGPLMTVTGFAFFVSPLSGQLDWPAARAVSMWLPDLWVLFFVLLVLTFLTGGRVQTKADRVLAGAVLVELVILAPLWMLFADGTPIAIWPHERAAEIIDIAQRVTLLAAVTGTAAVVAVRWWSASAPGRRALAPGVAGAVCLLLFAGLLLVQFLTGEKSLALLWIAACSLVAVPVVFLLGLLRSRLARGGLAGLFRGLRTMQPADLQGALAKALGDPDLVVGYPAADGYVDLDGQPVTRSGSTAGIERDGRQVAVLIYDRSLDDDPELVDAVTSAATIALENQHLNAEAQRRLAEVESSRERIIAAGDAERRRIERNLHDGAQQGLVTLAMQLSLIQREIRRNPADAEHLVTSASDQLAQSLAELRELARGIHPAVLDQGLEVALDALATRSAIPATVRCDPGPRLPQPVEFAAYFVASEALANAAKYAHASAVTISLLRTGPQTIIEITDNGIGGADPSTGTGLRGLSDRVETLHGHLIVLSPPNAGTTIRAELPAQP
ncbi:signal transduction histidine kinase [Kibdelosporangium banguiense]|uniref:histidine kinase n=1 Tax=Kibdelosporangium banguiense TaxID=1365924 RepID=A0ABS4TKL7_9PSEU|nr:histidine kinase [Kibdelosporangium banguiense]MBP2324967.1 signal transduction histidine kinase [Kibdelosporangium banguiense]